MRKRYWHLLEDGTACTNDGCPQPNLYWAQDWSEPRANKNLNFFLRSAFSSMKYYIIKSRHNQKSKARRHVILFPPVYIFPCKLELISRRANKEEIALSLSPDQIRSSKMAVHFFLIIWQGKLISETICCCTQCQVSPSQMDVHYFDHVTGDENTKPYLWNHFLDPSAGWLINKLLYIFLDQV